MKTLIDKNLLSWIATGKARMGGGHLEINDLKMLEFTRLKGWKMKKFCEFSLRVVVMVMILGNEVKGFGQSQNLKYASFNVITNSIIGGIGSGIHHKKSETFLHASLNGMWKGSISGGINSLSKQLLSIQAEKIKLNWVVCWSSKLINSVSNTMLYNVSINEPELLKNYSLNIGFIRLSINNYVQIEPISLGCFAYAIISGGTLNINSTLTFGTPIFNYKFRRIIVQTPSTIYSKPIHLGEILAQNILIQSGVLSNQILIHEVIHTYQRLQYTSLNNVIMNYSKYENFGIIHNDISIFDGLYFIQNKTIGYNYNYFELEANNYGKSE